MKIGHPLEGGHRDMGKAPSMPETRLLHSVVNLMATWGQGLTGFEAAEAIIKLVRKTDAAAAERRARAAGIRPNGSTILDAG